MSNRFFDRLFNIIPGYIFGLIAFSIGFSGDLVGILLSPNYQMWKSSISLLGLHPGGMYMRLGMIISNIFAAFFIIYLGKSLKDESRNDIVRKLAIGCGIFTTLSGILTGFFLGRTELLIYLHGMFALLSFVGGAVFYSLITFLIAKSSKFSKSITYIGIIISGIVVSYLIPFFITNFCSLFMSICYSLGESIYVIMPTYEWTMIFAILSWYLFNSIYLSRKKL
jgi:hypothetical protein